MLEGLQEPARVRQVLRGLRLLLVPQTPPVATELLNRLGPGSGSLPLLSL